MYFSYENEEYSTALMYHVLINKNTSDMYFHDCARLPLFGTLDQTTPDGYLYTDRVDIYKVKDGLEHNTICKESDYSIGSCFDDLRLHVGTKTGYVNDKLIETLIKRLDKEYIDSLGNPRVKK